MASKIKTRDIMIVAAVLAVVVVGYFVIVYPGKADFPGTVSPQARGEMTGTMDMALGSLEGLPEGFDNLVEAGNKYMDDQNYPVAAECYRRALEIKDDTDVRVDFGACLHGMGLADRALEEFATVLEHDPAHGVAAFNCGIVFYTQQRMDSAIVYFRKYLSIEPNGPAAQSARDLITELGGTY
ncbi:MAG TPA: tetratricopeptide repeat protein [candidate division Zixibacteria bacterium]|nr:tetratricopeptide repeat protein [candidate division Zixibacteria bacterium]